MRPSRAGKTMLMKAAVLELAPHLKIVKSTTTRAPREPDDALAYEPHISTERFEFKRRRGDFIEAVRYGNDFFGYDRGTVTVAMLRSHGICIATEYGILELKKKYPVRSIKVTSFGKEAEAIREAFYQEHPERKKADDEQALIPVRFALELNNDFAPGGKEAAVALFAEWIQHSVTR